MIAGHDICVMRQPALSWIDDDLRGSTTEIGPETKLWRKCWPGVALAL
jgi:hypothetical protein